MLKRPFYDPNKSYQENFADGPFGEFADGEVIDRGNRQPQHKFLDHQVYLPFGIPAGPLLNSNFVKAAFRKGFDICVYKTVRTRAHPCHQHPNILSVRDADQSQEDLSLKKTGLELVANDQFKTPLTITNSFGVPSPDPDWWQADMHKAQQSANKGQVMIGSFQGTRGKGETAEDLIKDYVLAARLVKETGTKILIANLSCPNEGKAELLCFDVPMVKRIAEAIKNEIGNLPLLLKLAYCEDESLLQTLMAEIGGVVQGLAVINTMMTKIINDDGTQALPGEGRLFSGVCGAGIKWAGLDMVKRLLKLRSQLNLDYAVVGMGGVITADDYKEYQELGADAVMSATGAMWNPNLAQEIWQSHNNN
jgi:dihydroorotate dehydrogenase (NAD+) catalytic subunit